VSDRLDQKRLQIALKTCTDALLAEMNAAGHWTGELSSSALSTAVAVIALEKMGQRDLVRRGLCWLSENSNADGGWGDTIRSRSNLSTTALVWAAFGATNQDQSFRAVVSRAQDWLWKNAGGRDRLPQAIIDRYGKDRTFSVPILMTLVLSGRLDKDGWRSVLPLPFELAAFPQSWFGALQLPVVSYALPALIAIGQTIHHHAPSKNPLARFIRNAVKETTLQRLSHLQPPNGGFLEATPLTSFVTMSLASMGLQQHPVARKGAAFLEASVRNNGSWPIDTNLATWVTTLSVKALSFQPQILSPSEKKNIREWLLNQQYKQRHPYTGAEPGGWAWTDLPGGVPDADDTAGALLALAGLGEDPDTIRAAESGVTWLLNLQNRDGGIPTFCKGWGTLPFDRSSPELTIHAMLAWRRWQQSVSPALAPRIIKATRSAAKFLAQSQRPNGAWIPLWFGNEAETEQENPIYGTARTLAGIEHLASGQLLNPDQIDRARIFIQSAQLPSGGWGGSTGCAESIEETALATEGLFDIRGANRLIELVESGNLTASPIGLYFARLWYFEKLYPLIFAVSALGKIASQRG
jgi:squalene-hopene/tetraprenyl-beta-curcumene cyclase